MIEIDATAAGFYVRVGPFATRELAEHVRETLTELSAEARAHGSPAAVPGSVLAAVASGQEHLERAPGHYLLRVDGAPGKPAHRVELSTGSNFTHITHAKTA